MLQANKDRSCGILSLCAVTVRIRRKARLRGSGQCGNARGAFVVAPIAAKVTDMADFPRNSILERAAREPDRTTSRSLNLQDAGGRAVRESAIYACRILPLARPAALACEYTETATKGGDKLPAHFPLAAGNGCPCEDLSDFPGSLAGGGLCALLARDRSLGSERDFV